MTSLTESVDSAPAAVLPGPRPAPLRVLQLVPTISGRSGGPQNVLGLAQALARRGVETTLFTTDFDFDGRLEVVCNQPLLREGVRLVHYRVWPGHRHGFSLDLAKALWSQVEQTDLLHIHWIYSLCCQTGALIARAKNVSYVIQPRGSLDPVLLARRKKRWKRLYLSTMGSLQLNSAAAVIFTSEEERHLAAHARVSAPKLVIGNGFDVSAYASLPERGAFRRRHLLEGRRLILFLGRLAWQKGLDLLLRSFARIAPELSDTDLVLAGPDFEGYERTLRALAGQLRLEDRVRFTGPVYGPEKIEAYVDSDLVVLPSYTENFGTVILEALACRRPLIVSRPVNISGIIERAEAGLVVDCESGALARAMRGLLSDPELAGRLARHGSDLVRRQFTWDAVVDQLLPLYERLRRAPVGGGRRP